MTILEDGLKRASGTSLALAIVLIIFGILAIALPLVSSIGVALVIGWMAIFAGIAQFVHAFQSKGIGPILWKVLVAVIYVVAGFSLIARPAVGVAGLTLVFAVFLFAEGITDIAYGYPQEWHLVDAADGIITWFWS
jgi:uncharacterized membrane protein HdeD (DUF308 family)